MGQAITAQVGRIREVKNVLLNLRNTRKREMEKRAREEKTPAKPAVKVLTCSTPTQTGSPRRVSTSVQTGAPETVSVSV